MFWLSAVALTSSLKHWQRSTPIPVDRFHTSTHPAVQQQSQIGWQDLLEGLPTKLWAQLQHQRLKLIKSLSYYY